MKKIFLLIGIAAFFIGCSKDNTPSPYTKAEIVSVAAPSSAAVNTDVTFALSYMAPTDCYTIMMFSENLNATTLDVTSFWRKDEQSVCAQTPVLKTKNYIWKFTAPGTYTVNFLSATSATISKTITIN